MHNKPARGVRIAAVSNAGYETVGIADAMHGAGYDVVIPKLSEATRKKLVEALARHKLDALVNTRNPLDVTPMATDQAYEDCVRVLLGADEIDAAIIASVPLTPAMLTTPDEIEQPGSLAERLSKLGREIRKPFVAVIDCGPLYNSMARMIRSAGVPVFRSGDQAVRSFGLYLCHRAAHTRTVGQPSAKTPVSKVVPTIESAGASPSVQPTEA